MSEAMKLIVDGYIKLKDRTALENLRSHRQRRLNELQHMSGLDLSRTISQIHDDLTVVETGLERFARSDERVRSNL
jgi:hypothetical protein